MPPTKEQLVWDKWNSAQVSNGLVGERVGLCETVVAEVKNLNFPHGSKMLDLGCGAGWTSERLHQDFDYLGLDFSEKAIADARLRLPQTKFETADFLVWKAPVSEFDVVLCVDTIAVIREQDAVIEKIARSLKSRGWLVITCVNPFCYSRWRKIGPPKDGQFRKWLSKRELHALLARHGFKVTKSRTILPAGDMGILRFVNSGKINRITNGIFGKKAVQSAKESIGLGQFQVVVAQLKQ